MWLNVGFDFVVCGFLLHYFFYLNQEIFTLLVLLFINKS